MTGFAELTRCILLHLVNPVYAYFAKSYVNVPVTLTVIPSCVIGVNVACRAAASAASRSAAGPF